MQFIPDGLQNFLKVLRDFIVPETQFFNVQTLQGLGSVLVVGSLFGFGVSAAIKFNGQQFFMAIEIEDKVAIGSVCFGVGDAVLAAEFMAP